ncbi:MAG TPA: PilN domain-containing protein [Vicinamibacterales bacterium]|nr:PilN domain-containing protein [Vicinamibacterales bacterium]
MIKVNLLSIDREKSKRKIATFQIGQKLTIACSLILVAAALLVGWWYWSLQRESADLDQQIVDAEQETVRLRGVLQQVQQFEQRRGQLQQRVTLIEQLRKGQTGPVHLLDEISKALPDTMWLLELRQTGAEVLIEGRCSSLNALSDFVSGLEASGLFVPPVEIVDSQVVPASSGSPELIRFTVRARLKPVS